MEPQRVPRLAILDPIEGIAYSRPLRKGGRYVEDNQLQALLDDKGIEAAKRFAALRYGGVMVAVLPAD